MTARAPLRRRVLLAAGLVIALVGAAARCGGRGPDGSGSAPAARPEPDPIPAGGPEPAVFTAAQGSEPAEPCDEARAELGRRVTEAEPQCRAALLAAGCVAPLAVSPPVFGRLKWQPKALARAMEGCPPRVRDAVLLDCSEFPCLGLISREALGSAACAFTERMAAVASSPDAYQVPPDPAGLTDDWYAFPWVAPRDELGDTNAAFLDRRLAARYRRLRQLLDERAPGEVAPLPSCAAVDRALAAMALDPCQGLAAVRDCPESPDTLPLPLVERHLAESRALVDRLIAGCPALADRFLTLQCDPLPCVLGVDAPEPLPFPRGELAACDPFLTDGLDLVTAVLMDRDPCRQTAIYPLYDLGGDPDETAPLMEAYFELRGTRLGQVCWAVEAQRDAAEDTDVAP